MCVFVARPMTIVAFLLKTVTSQNGLLIFFWKETHSETKSWIVKDFVEKKLQQQRQTLELVEDFACEDNTSESSENSHFSSFFSFCLFFLIFLHFSTWECVHAHLFFCTRHVYIEKWSDNSNANVEKIE